MLGGKLNPDERARYSVGMDLLHKPGRTVDTMERREHKEVDHARPKKKIMVLLKITYSKG